MSYADTLLARGEVIQYRARQHPLAPISDAVRPFIMILAGLALLYVATVIDAISSPLRIAALVLIVVALIWIVIVYLTWRAEEYIITNRRAIKVEGLLDKKAADSSLEKINDALLAQGLLARMLHYGDLEILTANEDAIDKYEMLNHVVTFKKAMLDAKNALEDGHVVASAPTAAAAAPDDLDGQLDRLASLRDRGKITQADYDRKKAELLDRM